MPSGKDLRSVEEIKIHYSNICNSHRIQSNITSRIAVVGDLEVYYPILIILIRVTVVDVFGVVSF